MTPPPSDADKPGPGGPKPGAAPQKPGQPGPGRPDLKPVPKGAPTPGGAQTSAAKPVPPVPPQAGKPPGAPPPVPPTPVPPAASGTAAQPPRPGETRPADPKPGEAKLGDAKPGDAKPGEPPVVAFATRPDTPAVGAPGAKADAVKDTPGAEAAKPAGVSPKPDAPGAGPATVKAEAGKPDLARSDPAKPEAAKTEPSKSDPAKPDAARAEPPRSGPAGAGGPAGPGPQSGPRPGGPAGPVAAAAVKDGPIIDLKAQRVPDPAAGPARDAGRAGTEPPKGAEPPKPAAAGPGAARPDAAAKPDASAKPDAAAKPGAARPDAARPEPVRTGAGPVAPVPPAKGGAGFGTVAAAGLLGGVVGAGLLFAVGKAGLTGDQGRLTALDQKLSGRIESVEQRVAGLAPKDALAALDKRVAGAEGTARQALDRAGGASPQATPQGGTVTDGQPGAAPASVPADLLARLDSLDQRVSALQEEPGRDQPGDARVGVAQGDAGRQVADLDARVKALEGAGAKPGAAPASDLPQKLAALQGEVESRTRANSEADAALSKRLDGLRQDLDARAKAAADAAQAGQAQAAEASKAVDRRLQEQSEKIAALDTGLARRAEATTVQAALRVVVADRLASALAAGMPYAEPLATLRRLDPGAEGKTAALAPFAEGGAPTAGQLAETFRGIADGIAAKRRAARVKAAAEGTDFRAKLLSMADGLVQVRRVDAPAPEAASAPEEKVQAALDRGDLDAASAAFAALPPEAQAEAGDFGTKLKARAQAGQAVRALTADAFKALPAPAAGR